MDYNVEELAEGGFLPPFANAENRAINSKVLELRATVEELSQAIEQNSDSMGVMSEHLRNVQQELTYTESRVEANRKEIETEEHLRQLADRELGRLGKDVDKLTRERLELQDRVNALQQQIFRNNEKLEEYKSLITWNQEELDQWAVAHKQKEEDNAAFDRYKRQDEFKVRELETGIERLTKGVSDTKRDLEDEVTETQAAQTQLDKAAEDFRCGPRCLLGPLRARRRPLRAAAGGVGGRRAAAGAGGAAGGRRSAATAAWQKRC